ncbi:MAG: hypothetical protein ACFFAN_01675 [Promethearchaeota archaeon]
MTSIEQLKKEAKKKKLRGFANVIEKRLESAQKVHKKKVEELIKGLRSRVVYNPKDGKWAALITIDNGNITVEGIKNTPKENLSRKKLLWWGYMETSIQNFMNAEKISNFKWFLKMIRFNTKIRGIPHVRLIGDIIALSTQS